MSIIQNCMADTIYNEANFSFPAMHGRIPITMAERSSARWYDDELSSGLALHGGTLELCSGPHLLLDGCDGLGPPPRRYLALVQLVDLGGGSTIHVVTSDRGCRIFDHSPFGFGQVKPHEDASRCGECAVDESGLQTECQEHGRSSVADAKVSVNAGTGVRTWLTTTQYRVWS